MFEGPHLTLNTFVLQKMNRFFWLEGVPETPKNHLFRGTTTLLCQISPILMNDGFLTKSASMIFVDGRWIDEFNGNKLPIPSLLQDFIS